MVSSNSESLDPQNGDTDEEKSSPTNDTPSPIDSTSETLDELFTNLEALKLSPGFDSTEVKRIRTMLPVRKPRGQEYFRVKSGEDSEGNSWRFETLLLKDSSDRDSFYLIAPALRDTLQGEGVPVQLRLAQNRQGNFFLFPVPLPKSDGRSNSWHETARAGVELAEHVWVRLKPSLNEMCYEIFQARENGQTDPSWDCDQLQTVRACLRLAFKDRAIDSADHPLVRRLLHGEE